MKKPIPLAVLVPVLFAVFISGCLSSGDGVVTLEDGMVLEQSLCASKGIENSVIVFHSLSCGACLRTVPVPKELESELGREFEFIDIAADKERVDELGLVPTLIPTTIIKCKVHVGYKTKDEFRRLIG